MPRVMNITTPATVPVAGARDRYGPTVRPDMDWTGIPFKAVGELTVNYSHEGRISDPAQRARGFTPRPSRGLPLDREIIPGIGDSWRHSSASLDP